MAESKKASVDVQTQEKIWNLLQYDDEVIMDIKGEVVKVTRLSAVDDQEAVIKEIEADQDLQKMLLDSEADEKAGRVYTADEAMKFIQESQSK